MKSKIKSAKYEKWRKFKGIVNIGITLALFLYINYPVFFILLTLTIPNFLNGITHLPFMELSIIILEISR